MSKNNMKNKKSFETASNVQEKLTNAVNSLEAQDSTLNKNHNTKKGSLGPNTKR